MVAIIMKEYAFVSLSIDVDHLFNTKTPEHRAIIEEKAKSGYRYVDYIPTNMSDYGKIRSMDLIFEREIEESTTPT
jgi:hypothetical protein